MCVCPLLFITVKAITKQAGKAADTKKLVFAVACCGWYPELTFFPGAV